MKGYHFYAEMPDARCSKSASKFWPAFTRKYLVDTATLGYHVNVIAVPLDGRGRPLYQGSTLNFDAFAGVSGRENAPVEGCSSSRDYLSKRCVRVSAELAEKLHPAMFSYLKE